MKINKKICRISEKHCKNFRKKFMEILKENFGKLLKKNLWKSTNKFMLFQKKIVKTLKNKFMETLGNICENFIKNSNFEILCLTTFQETLTKFHSNFEKKLVES